MGWGVIGVATKQPDWLQNIAPVGMPVRNGRADGYRPIEAQKTLAD
ncbi:MAG: hypothetical protein VX007_03680 [Pseudomonadota bacterium]|nr:hypothetical protein [Pseudomonadota bacterium]